jgi:ferrous iron transport protein A
MHIEPAAASAATGGTVSLSDVAIGASVVIREVRTGFASGEEGDIGLRLLELGFVEGEQLRVVAHGHPGREPVAVRIGNTTFALRRFEADHVRVAPLNGSAR